MPVMNVKNNIKTHNNPIQRKETLRQIRAKNIEEKRANIEARRRSVTKFSTYHSFDEKVQNLLIDKNLNEKVQTNHVIMPGSDMSMPSLKFEFVDEKSDVSNIQEINIKNEMKSLEIKNEKDDINNNKILRKKKSNNWIEYKKNVFDKASLVYLQSKTAKEFIERRKLEELEKKRITVNKIRNFHTVAIEKRHQKSNSRVKEKPEDIIEKVEKKELLDDQLNLDETESILEREISEEEEEENDDESMIEMIEESASENEEYSDNSETIVSKDFTDSDESLTDSDLDDEKEASGQDIVTHDEEYTEAKEKTENIINNKENDTIKLKKGIKAASIILKACENINNKMSKDIPMDILNKVDEIKAQRQNRRERIENLRRSRFEEAEQMRVDSLLAKYVVRTERELRVNDSRRRIKDSKTDSRQSKPQVSHNKSPRWIQERQLVEQNVAAKFEEEIKNLKKQL